MTKFKGFIGSKKVLSLLFDSIGAYSFTGLKKRSGTVFITMNSNPIINSEPLRYT